MGALTLSFVAEAAQGTLIGHNTSFGGVAVDSREVKPGQLFFALPGARTDGHDFMPEAVQSGAVAAVVSRPLHYNCPVVLVKDTRAALGQVARAYLNSTSARVVAITGSVGKTSCKEMAAAAIQAQFSVLKSPGNLNTDIGLPVSVLSHQGEEVLVLEMAMRGLGQIAELTEIAPPDVAIITNIGESHLALLGSRDNIARAKSEIILGTKKGATTILNRDDDYFDYLRGLTQGTLLSFGMHEEADFRISSPTLGDMGNYGFTLTHGGNSFRVESPWPGRHNICNASAALAAASALGVELNLAIKALSSCGAAKDRRLNVSLLSSGITLIDDTYNASPSSVIAALETLSEMPAAGRRVGVLGSMYELGDRTVPGHQEVGSVAARRCDLVVTVGEEAQIIAQEVRRAGRPVFSVHTPQEAIVVLRGALKSGDVVLVKGSRGLRMEQIAVALNEGVVSGC